MVELSDRHVQFPESIFDATQDGTFLLERARARDVKLKRKKPDHRHSFWGVAREALSRNLVYRGRDTVPFDRHPLTRSGVEGRCIKAGGVAYGSQGPDTVVLPTVP